MSKALSLREQTEQTLMNLAPELRQTLPSTISAEKFVQVTMTALSKNKDILEADRTSFFNAVRDCAKDGLLPDGKQAALVIFSRNLAKKGQPAKWAKLVQYMPMVGGVIHKGAENGFTIRARTVYEGDEFRRWEDDRGEHIHWQEADSYDEEPKVKCYYATARRGDDLWVERLNPHEAQAVKAAATARKPSPAWDMWFDRMAQKSVIHRLVKRLPLDADSSLARVLERGAEDMDWSAPVVPAALPGKPAPKGVARLEAALGVAPEPDPVEAEVEEPPPSEDPPADLPFDEPSEEDTL